MDPLYDDPKPTLQTPKKKNAPVNVFQVALLRMRGRSGKSRVLPVDDGSKSIWRKMVGSMRPLHLQSSQSPRSFSETDSQPPTPSLTATSDYLAEDESYSPSPPSTRYASAEGLNELMQSDEENEKHGEILEECKEHDNGDDMIDAKADEFIAQFYQQMRLQRLSFTDRVYKERSERSLG
ncbi:uncharacterized protein LOC133297975 [Gastrolobium bilobum]|uniref:uncharacterized protein LOC133297975 n=1 Tax=Gastrolobium bilobum TaxID=150636 RepID=UPI002AB02991|nr:uncharacterized protein LOC133297975 [Gastrolobium bilobum]